jgi:ABC-type sugar transport system permease subunit
VAAVAWRDVFHPQQGLIAQALGHPFPWSASPELSLIVLLIASTWMGWPLWMLVATAGMRTIPRAVTEAAQLDGASAWQRFAGVTLPMLLPLLGAAFVVRAVTAFNQFYLFYVLEPSDPTTTLATFSFYVFSTTSGGIGLMAVSAAINIITMVALMAVVAWFLNWRSRVERLSLA